MASKRHKKPWKKVTKVPKSVTKTMSLVPRRTIMTDTGEIIDEIKLSELMLPLFDYAKATQNKLIADNASNGDVIKPGGKFSNAAARKALGNDISVPSTWLQPYRVKELMRTEAWRLLSSWAHKRDIALTLDKVGWDTPYEKLTKAQRKGIKRLEYENLRRHGSLPSYPQTSNPRLNLACVNDQYSKIQVDWDASTIRLDMIVTDRWITLLFDIPMRTRAIRSSITKITKPTIRYDGDTRRIAFDFAIVQKVVQNEPDISSCLCFDIGKLMDNSIIMNRVYSDGRVGGKFLPSSRSFDVWCHLLKVQDELSLCVARRDRRRAYGLPDNDGLLRNIDSLSVKRSRLKQLFAREVACDIVAVARAGEPIVTEDLSWLESTGGSWNFSEIIDAVRWLCGLTGHEFVLVSAVDASHECPVCHERVVPDGDRVSRCKCCGWAGDRDVSACLVMGSRFFGGLDVHPANDGVSRGRRARRVSHRLVVRSCFDWCSGVRLAGVRPLPESPCQRLGEEALVGAGYSNTCSLANDSMVYNHLTQNIRE